MNEEGYVTLDDFMASQPPESQTRVEAGYQKMVRQVEDFQALRRVIALSRSELAQKLNAAEGSFCQLERRTERAMRTLRRFAARMGGDLAITILLPDQPPIQLNSPSLPLDQPTADAPV